MAEVGVGRGGEDSGGCKWRWKVVLRDGGGK